MRSVDRSKQNRNVWTRAAVTYNQDQPNTVTNVAKNKEELKLKLLELQTEHRDLDDVINRLSQDSTFDQLQIKRLKKRKLILKDRIELLKSALIPDLNA